MDKNNPEYLIKDFQIEISTKSQQKNKLFKLFVQVLLNNFFLILFKFHDLLEINFVLTSS